MYTLRDAMGGDRASASALKDIASVGVGWAKSTRLANCSLSEKPDEAPAFKLKSPQ